MVLVNRGKILFADDHLFWDIDIHKIKPIKNKKLIIERILTRGNFQEFALLNNFYSRKTIKDVIVNISSLPPIILNGLSKFYNIDKSKFKCTQKRLKNQHWIY